MIITLTTDFGLRDPFVGIMKGVILNIAPNVRLVDLTHEIQSFDIGEAAAVIGSSWQHFPPGTIHVVVVDPGVGSERRPLAASMNEQIFVGPDNGVLSRVLYAEALAPIPAVYEIINESMFHKPVSGTFHGRDIFAPVAAHLARGAPIDSVGPRVIDFMNAAVPKPKVHGENILAMVVRVDKYGNIITNLKPAHLKDDFCIHIGGREVRRVCSSYVEAEAGEFFAIEGSTGDIEIALNRGSAAEKLAIHVGSEIEVETGGANH